MVNQSILRTISVFILLLMECRLKKLEKIDTFFEETKNLKTSKAH